MNTHNPRHPLQLGLLALALTLALPAQAASDNASEAARHSALAAGHSVVAGSQVVSGAVAVPLVIVGGIGTVSAEAGEALLEHALTPQPLEISDEHVIADPAPRHFGKPGAADGHAPHADGHAAAGNPAGHHAQQHAAQDAHSAQGGF